MPQKFMNMDQLPRCYSFIKDGLETQELQIQDIICSQIILKYQCSFLCPLCSRSNLYKNAKEKEERILISFTLKSKEHYASIKAFGVTATLFQALLLVNSNPKPGDITTIPIHKYIYDYIESSSNSYQEIVFSFLEDFTRRYDKVLKQASILVIEDYLHQLQKEEESSPIIIEGILRDSFQFDLPVHEENKKQLPDQHKVQQTKKHPSPACIKPKNAISSKESAYSHVSEAVTNIIEIHTEQKESICQFRRFLLLNIVLAVEIVQNEGDKEEYLLLYGSHTFCKIPTSDKMLPELLYPILTYSNIRKFVCYDPYRLYHFLAAHALPNRSVYSIRTAYRILAQEQNREYRKTPEQVFKEITSRTNDNQLPDYLFDMSQYAATYQVIEKSIPFQKDAVCCKFMEHSKVDALLGTSFYLNETTESSNLLFDYDKQQERCFFYHSNIKMKPDYKAISYLFELQQGDISCFLRKLLSFLADQKLMQQANYRLLKYTKNIIAFAIHRNDICAFRDIIFHCTSSIGEKYEMSPIKITETDSPA